MDPLKEFWEFLWSICRRGSEPTIARTPFRELWGFGLGLGFSSKWGRGAELKFCRNRGRLGFFWSYRGPKGSPETLNIGYCPPPVTVYISGFIKGSI